MSQTSPTTMSSGSPSSAPTSGVPMWRLSPQWAHFGERIEDVMREAVDTPYSRCMQKRAAGQEPTIWDYVMDMVDVLERV